MAFIAGIASGNVTIRLTGCGRAIVASRTAARRNSAVIETGWQPGSGIVAGITCSRSRHVAIGFAGSTHPMTVCTTTRRHPGMIVTRRDPRDGSMAGVTRCRSHNVPVGLARCCKIVVTGQASTGRNTHMAIVGWYPRRRPMALVACHCGRNVSVRFCGRTHAITESVATGTIAWGSLEYALYMA